MSKQVNPLLASYYRQFEAEHRHKRDILNQITLASCILAAHEVFKCGPGRAARFIAAYVKYKQQVAAILADDVRDSRRTNGDGDRDFLKTRRDLAAALQPIFGQDGWMQCQEFFPVLRDFWLYEGKAKKK